MGNFLDIPTLMPSIRWSKKLSLDAAFEPSPIAIKVRNIVYKVIVDESIKMQCEEIFKRNCI